MSVIMKVYTHIQRTTYIHAHVHNIQDCFSVRALFTSLNVVVTEHKKCQYCHYIVSLPEVKPSSSFHMWRQHGVFLARFPIVYHRLTFPIARGFFMEENLQPVHFLSRDRGKKDNHRVTE